MLSIIKSHYAEYKLFKNIALIIDLMKFIILTLDKYRKKVFANKKLKKKCFSDELYILINQII